MFGRQLLANNTIHPTRVSADGSPVYKTGGLGIDWTTVAAVGSDTTLPDGSVVLAGQKYLRYGQILAKITATGLFGPADLATPAVDGRQTLARGDCFILDETVTQYGAGSSSLSAPNDQIGGVFDTGRVFIDRVLQTGVGAHTLLGGPTLAEFLAAFTGIEIVRN